MLRQRVGDQAILVDAIDDAIGGWFAQAAMELNLDVVDTPQIDIGDELPELGKPFSFTATGTVMPEVELGQYKGVEVPKEPTRSPPKRWTLRWTGCATSSPSSSRSRAGRCRRATS